MKISPLTIFVWCIAISMIAITYGLSKRDPIMKTTENWVKYRDSMAAEQRKWRLAVKKVQDATTLAKATVVEWQNIAGAHTLPTVPDPNGIDLTLDGWRLAMEMSNYRNKLQAMVNAQVKAGGVTVVQGPVVPTPPAEGDRIISGYFNYPPLTTPVLVFNLGNITVTGTYQQITDNVKAWSRMPHFLAVADGLRLNGTSPRLTGNYAVTIVGFVKVPTDPLGVPKGIFPPLPEGGRVMPTPPPAGGGGPVNATQPGNQPAQGRGARVPGRNTTGGGGTAGADGT
jgi:hypothetical protein